MQVSAFRRSPAHLSARSLCRSGDATNMPSPPLSAVVVTDPIGQVGPYTGGGFWTIPEQSRWGHEGNRTGSRRHHGCVSMPSFTGACSIARSHSSVQTRPARCDFHDLPVARRRAGAVAGRFLRDNRAILRFWHGEGGSHAPVPGADPSRMRYRPLPRDKETLDDRLQSRPHVL